MKKNEEVMKTKNFFFLCVEFEKNKFIIIFASETTAIRNILIFLLVLILFVYIFFIIIYIFSLWLEYLNNNLCKFKFAFE